jgi:hypothetical protein
MIGTLDEGRDKEKGSRTAADRQPERTKQAAAAK